MFQEIATKRVLILGCGNVLMGDDGFGPAVIARLEETGRLPEHVHAEDVGTSVRDVLFNIAYAEPRPERVVVLDAVDKPGREAGEVFEISVDDIPEQKIIDYSFHQFPTTNLLKDIQDQSGVEVTILAAQVGGELTEVRPELSEIMQAAVRNAAEKVLEMVNGASP